MILFTFENHWASSSLFSKKPWTGAIKSYCIEKDLKTYFIVNLESKHGDLFLQAPNRWVLVSRNHPSVRCEKSIFFHVSMPIVDQMKWQTIDRFKNLGVPWRVLMSKKSHVTNEINIFCRCKFHFIVWPMIEKSHSFAQNQNTCS